MLTTARTSQPNQPWQGGHPKLWMPALFGEQTLRDGEKEKMIDRNVILKTTWMLLAGVLASSMLVLPRGPICCPGREVFGDCRFNPL